MEIGSLIGLIIFIAVLLLSILIFIAARTKKCPPDKIMVIYGRNKKNKDGTTRSAKCIHGGLAFIIPVVQAYSFLDLTPMSINVELRKALSRQQIRIDVPSVFTIGISTDNGVMQNAAERLRGLQLRDIQELAKDIILGQLRSIVAMMDIEEINADREKFLESIQANVETELKKIGLKLINVNITDIMDESGYIAALGKEAAARVINEARKSVAEKERDGAIGVSNADRDKRIEVAKANASAVQGENETLARISQSNAARREIEAESEKIATIAEMTAEARSKEAAYLAEQKAEEARAQREKATLEADTIVQAEIQKRKIELEAEAEAEKIRRHARGEADAIKAMKQAEAEGLFAILAKQAEGFEKIVKAAGGTADHAVKLLLVDKIEALVRTQVEAIKNIKIDKITVWDGGQGAKDGMTTTAGFLSGIGRAIPPLNDLFKMTGLEMPSYLGSEKAAEQPAVSAPKTAPAPKK